MRQQRPKNASEAHCFDVLTYMGWDVWKRGWPDFVCYRGGELICVEVKPRSSHPLKWTQKRVMVALAARGVRCFKYSPDGGFEEIEAITDPSGDRLLFGA